MLISESYKSLNKKLHESRPDYGTSGRRYADAVRDVARIFACDTILDYGCGKRTLEAELGWKIANYDPAIPGLASPPVPADLVVCTDVLEHVEPELLDNVLRDIARCTQRAALLVAHMGPAVKYLEDGRNAHLIQEGAHFWCEVVMRHFRVHQVNCTPGEICFVCTGPEAADLAKKAA